jgi:hypothetical protein
VDHNHSVWHIGERPEGCHHQPRRCLLKGCERLYWSRHPRSHYCSVACRRAARHWQCWRASQQYRATENGKQQRREQSKRYRERVRAQQQQPKGASADADSPREGQRIASAQADFSGWPCARPGCYELFAIPHEHSNKRFCSVACRLALRRVLDREARYQARRRRMRCERVTKRARPPDSS